MKKRKQSIFHAFYFLKNCKLDGEIELEKGVKLIPFEGFSVKSDMELVEKFMKERGKDFGFELDRNFPQSALETKKKYMKKIKMAVLFIPIRADTIENVKKTLDPVADNVMFILSAFKNTYVERAGYFAIDVSGKNGLKTHAIYYFDIKKIYKDYDSRKLSDDKQITMVLSKIQDIHHTIEKYDLIKHSKQLYYEYIAEDNEDWGFLRLWNILEIQSENRTKLTKTKIFTKKDIKKIRKVLYQTLDTKDIDDQLKSKKISSILTSLNYPPIKDKIRKMLGEYQLDLNPIDESHDIIDQIYQYRNCLIHYGGCAKKRSLRVSCESWCKNSIMDSDTLRKELRNFVLQIIFRDFNIYFMIKDN
ncbi:hypothetical protein GOV13_03160 [Candidatus Pacearchaeota archaeon]|nr:hypothetical protein [Candidatus Pacearchaeota archaeon]